MHPGIEFAGRGFIRDFEPVQKAASAAEAKALEINSLHKHWNLLK
jgi:hypothetical protein